MSRCGCTQDCSCVVQGSDCVAVGGTGTLAAPFVPSLVIDPDPNNQASCGASGLNAPLSLVIGDTDCIDLSGTGLIADPLLATPIFSADVCNLLSCEADGLDAVVYTADSTCVELDGCGTAGDPLVATVVVAAAGSGGATNILECLPTGLFVPAGSAAAANYGGQVSLSADQTFPTTATWFVNGYVTFDTSDFDIGGVVDLANNGFTIPFGGDGWYLVECQLYTYGPDYGLSGLSTFGYNAGMAVQVNGGAASPVNGSVGARQAPAVNNTDATYDLTLDTANMTYLVAGDLVQCFFSFIEIAGLVNVGSQIVKQDSFLKIMQVLL